MALTATGCSVQAVCPRRNPIRVTSVFGKIYTYRALAPLHSFAEAIRKARPALVIPGDDLAVLHFHQLYARHRAMGTAGQEACALIERSLGDPSGYPTIESRSLFLELAAREHIRTPEFGMISDLVALRRWMERVGLPTVLKADGTSGGEGVRIVSSAKEAERAFRQLQGPPLFARVVKRAVVDQNATLVWPFLLRSRHDVSVQAYITGREATSSIACWNGSVLAQQHFEVVSKTSTTGPSTVLRLIENREMSAACEKMVRRLRMSGVVGFDFMIEAETQDPYLIEINARPTQVGHLALGPRRDFAAALVAMLTGRPLEERARMTEKDTITLFPHEWLSNPASPFLVSGHHDVPWDEPEFIRACVGNRRKQIDLNALRPQNQTLPTVI